jgi:uncharacterized membrane protein YfcA
VIESVVIAVAGFLAGGINAIAGGGTLVSFPALLWIGRNAIIANATSTVAIWPGGLAGVYAFRHELKRLPRWYYLLVIPSLLGGILGAFLLLKTPTSVFEKLVPLLIFIATVLLGFQEVIARKVRVAGDRQTPGNAWIAFSFLFQFFVGVYGGYFGAGIGILMLAALGLIGLQDMHQMNGLKNLLGACMNGVAAVYFVLSGAVIWSDVAVMALAAIVGGLASARLARKLGQRFVRYSVVAIGLIMTIALLIRSQVAGTP